MGSRPDDLTGQQYPAGQRRRFERRRVEAAVALCNVASSVGRIWRGHTLTLSEGGAGVIVGGPWLPGQVVRMELTFAGSPNATQLTARIAHRNKLFCGLEFLGHSEQAKSELRQVLGAA